MDDRRNSQACYEFAGYRLDGARRVIYASDDGRRLNLEPRIFDAALYFAEHPGAVISKERLLSTLWPDSVVEENNLTQVISGLRRALGELRGQNRYITTIPRRGYCFVAPVIRIQSWNEALDDECSVTVRQFHNWSTRSDEWLTVGITESICHRLSRLVGIRLVAQVSSSTTDVPRTGTPGLADPKPPRLLIDGSLRRIRSRLRITARLIDLADCRQISSMRFDRTTRNVFAVEDDVSRRVAAALRANLPRHSETEGAPRRPGGRVRRGLVPPSLYT